MLLLLFVIIYSLVNVITRKKRIRILSKKISNSVESFLTFVIADCFSLKNFSHNVVVHRTVFPAEMESL